MPKTIITVDDSASIRQMVSFTLRTAGYEVIEAADGEQALERLSVPVDLVITDLHMPGMNGIELLKKIRSLPSLKYLPVVLLTTESHADRVKEAKGAGATGWIVKPFGTQQLLAIVQKVLG